MRKFKADDVVRFADGNGKMFLWGDHVTIDWMTVTGYDDETGRVMTVSHPYDFQFDEDALVKVGELHDTVYDTDPASANYGNEIYVWLTELNEPEDGHSEECDTPDLDHVPNESCAYPETDL